MSVKTLLFDIETSPILAYTWGVWQHNIQPAGIVEDRKILCICWKELGKRGVSGRVVGDGVSERDVIEAFRAAAEDADVLVAHNGDKFDVKHLNAKLIEYRIDPLPKLHTVDTLKEVKKIAKFTYNRLDFLAQKLFGVGKHDTDFDLWKGVMGGDAKASARMLAYCKNDVILLERLYVALRPYFKNHPNIATHDSMNCPRCNCEVVTLRKAYRTKSGLERAHFNCAACRAPFTIAATKVNRPLSAV